MPELEEAGHDVVAVDLPCADDSAGFDEYTDVVVEAIVDRQDFVLVAQSLGGFTAPLVTDRVAPELIEAAWDHVIEQSGTPFEKPWPLDAWPSVATRFLLCRKDRFFPAEFQRRVVPERLGITPDEMDSGHLPALAQPKELAARLLAYEAGGRTQA